MTDEEMELLELAQDEDAWKYFSEATKKKIYQLLKLLKEN